MSPVTRRRRTRAIYAGHGVVVARIEDDARLWQAGEIYRDLRRDRPATYQVVLFDPDVVAAARAASGAGELAFESAASPLRTAGGG